MVIEPLGTRIVIELIEKANISDGGIHIPESAQTKSTEGIVIAVGPGRQNEDYFKTRDISPVPSSDALRGVEKHILIGPEFLPMYINVGDRVMFSKYGGNEVEIGKRKFTILEADQVFCVLRPEGDNPTQESLGL